MDKQDIQLNKELTEGIIGAEAEVLKEMIRAGIIYGHKKTKTNPKFKKYILTTRNGMEIIDLAKTLPLIDKAAEFLKSQIKSEKMVLLVGLQPAAQPVLEAVAEKLNLPFVKNRWIGGLLTNFKAISGRIENFKKIKAGMERGDFDKYTKKERVMINKDLARMKEMFGGLENLTRPVEAIFMVDLSLKGHMTAVREARRMKIPVAAIIDSDDNPEFVNYPIPANDHAKASIEWIVNGIIEKLGN
ncbi:MAG: 30S ribosomal protein S2 [Patescibacteria group bacterium]|nr:30S ribosomal protein S2 [Patescibacteria group bacterium]